MMHPAPGHPRAWPSCARRRRTGQDYLLDSDKGVVLPFGLAYAETHPDDVAHAYRAAGLSAETAAWAADVYGPKGNVVAGNPRRNRPKLFWIERGSAVLCWVLPLILLVKVPKPGDTP